MAESSSDEGERSDHSSRRSTVVKNSPPKDYSDPYYIHPNENPSLVLVNPILDGPNYHCWIQAMTMALEMKNKFVFVDGSITRPPISDPKFPRWKRCNMLTLSWINRAVNTEISSSILWITDAYDVWKELRNRFSQGDNTRIANLKTEVYSMKQGELSVTSYFTKLRVLWDELCNFDPIPICESPPGTCCCNTSTRVLGYRNRDIVMTFLQGLNENFAAVRSQILIMEPLPPISRVYSMIIQQERQIGTPIVVAEASVAAVQTSAMPSAGRGRGRGTFPSKGNNRLCTFCNRTNHTVDTCFMKHGFPSNFPSKGSKKVVNNVAIEDQSASSSSPSCPVQLTADQWQSLLSLLPTASPTASASANMVTVNSIVSTPAGNILITWLVDTGATDHIACSLEFFNSYYAIKPVLITLPSGDIRYSCFKGTINLTPSITLYDVYYIPNWSSNIISVGQLADTINCRTLFDGSCAILQDIPSKKVIGHAKRDGKLYTMKVSPLVPTSTTNSIHCNNVSVNDVPIDIWHNRLGHPSPKVYSLIQKLHCNIPNLSMKNCDACHYAKQKRLPFPTHVDATVANFDLVHMDIWGPFATPSVNGNKYFLTIVDDKSRFTWIKLMRAKSETRKHIMQFVSFIQTQFSHKIKSIRSDNGIEFVMPEFYLSKGIIHQKTCVESPQQNGVVERKHQHILNVARSLMFQSNIPIQLWDFAICHAIHLINQLPSPHLQSVSPYFLLYGKHPDLSLLRIFGSLCYASTLVSHRTKFLPRARKCVHIGHSQGVKGFLLFDLKNHEIFLSRNVSFYENIFPYFQQSSSSTISGCVPSRVNLTEFFPTDDVANTYDTDKTHNPTTDMPSPTSPASLISPLPTDKASNTSPIPVNSPEIAHSPTPLHL